MTQAQALLDAINFTGTTHSMTRAQAGLATSLATTLDKYNNTLCSGLLVMPAAESSDGPASRGAPGEGRGSER
jgi:hypothetical protein